MPSAYTAGIIDGTMTELRDFALLCARALGACVAMRDEPLSAPIPDAFEPSPYHAKKIAELTEKRDALLALTPEQADAEAAKARADYDLRRKDAEQAHNDQRARYQAMIAKVEPWEGAPEGIKEFMLSQLREGMEFDCGRPFRMYEQPPAATGKDWLSDKIAVLNRELAYHLEHDAEESLRTRSRNEWLAQLRASLEGA